MQEIQHLVSTFKEPITILASIAQTIGCPGQNLLTASSLQSELQAPVPYR